MMKRLALVGIVSAALGGTLLTAPPAMATEQGDYGTTTISVTESGSRVGSGDRRDRRRHCRRGHRRHCKHRHHHRHFRDYNYNYNFNYNENRNRDRHRGRYYDYDYDRDYDRYDSISYFNYG